ncbi:unnamed protein product [Agarophyton chilense]
MANASGAHVVPTEVTQSRLKACMSCSLIKTTQQFYNDGCDNCPFMSLNGDKERISACTTSQFVGTYVVMNPSKSWVAKWQRVASFAPGAYAIHIDARMPNDIVEQLEENRIRMHSVLATTDKPDG